MTIDPKIKIFPYNPKIRPANPSNKKLNWSGLTVHYFHMNLDISNPAHVYISNEQSRSGNGILECISSPSLAGTHWGRG